MQPVEFGELALSIAQRAGALLADRAATGVTAVQTKSSRHDVVTQADRDSETLIRRLIGELRPNDQVVGEEQGVVGNAASVRWIVDPLDGTVNFLFGIPSWAVSIAVEVSGTVIAGAVVAPALGEEYVAAHGSGAWLLSSQGRSRLHVSTVPTLSDALVGTGFGYRPECRAAQGRVIAALLPEVRDIRRVGAAAVDLCWVARGRLDAHFERGLQEWDRAAGALIAREAGAAVLGPGAGPHSSDLLVAANPVLATGLLDRLTQLDAMSGD